MALEHEVDEGLGGEDEEHGDGDGDEGAVVGGKPAESGGAVGVFAAEGLADEGLGADHEGESGHESDGFDIDSDAHGGEGVFGVGDLAEDAHEEAEAADAEEGHEAGGGGDAGEALHPVHFGEAEIEADGEGGGARKEEVDNGADPGRGGEGDGGSHEAEACAGDLDAGDVVAGVDEGEIEDEVDPDLAGGNDHRGFAVSDGAEAAGEGLDDVDGGEAEDENGDVLTGEESDPVSAFGDEDALGDGGEGEPDEHQDEADEDGESDGFLGGGAEFFFVAGTEGAGDDGGRGGTEGHAEAEEEEDEGAAGGDGGEGRGIGLAVEFEVSQEEGIEELVDGLEEIEGDGGAGELPDGAVVADFGGQARGFAGDGGGVVFVGRIGFGNG